MFCSKISAYFTGKGHRHNPLEIGHAFPFKKVGENLHTYSTLQRNTLDGNTQHFRFSVEARKMTEPSELAPQKMTRKSL